VGEDEGEALGGGGLTEVDDAEGAGGVGVEFGTVGIGIEHAVTTARTTAPSRPYAARVRRCQPTITSRAYVGPEVW
jgi:hypothetical protein